MKNGLILGTKFVGGGLSGRIAKILPVDFLRVVEDTVHRVQFTYGVQESFLIESSKPIAYTFMRQSFDQWLVDKARQSGAVIHEDEPVVEIRDAEKGVQVFTKLDRYRC